MRILNKAYIIGAGETKYGELWEKSLRELAVEAGLKAVENAGIFSKEIEVLYGSNSLAGTINGQENIGSLISDFSGIAENNIPAIRIEASTASGGAAVRQAYLAVKSGEYDVVMVGGVEKMTDIYGSEIIDLTSSVLDREWEAFLGGKLECRISAVICERKNAGVLERSRKLGINGIYIPYSRSEPEKFHREALNTLNDLNPDLVVLAGFLKILDSSIIQRFPYRIINLHPSLLPCFGGPGFYGARVHEAVIRSGTKYSGTTVHCVTENIDGGGSML